ncbi:actin-related protein 2/3 complex subunit 3 [Anopheles sinensis]|uniref:Actin-related protein 2/3 complex subunit 3 n=1 Tax=Anopheles sinensis TaxID=74873 RepID=A0A084W5Q8_ANOSI|nr:actin-related protein 2/3 complex subunit 3 [Anopheles sinensis]
MRVGVCVDASCGRPSNSCAAPKRPQDPSRRPSSGEPASPLKSERFSEEGNNETGECKKTEPENARTKHGAKVNVKVVELSHNKPRGTVRRHAMRHRRVTV